MKLLQAYFPPSQGMEQQLIALFSDDEEAGNLVLAEYPAGENIYELLQKAVEYTKQNRELMEEWARITGFDPDDNESGPDVEELWCDVLRLPQRALDLYRIRIEIFDEEIEFRGWNRRAMYKAGNGPRR